MPQAESTEDQEDSPKVSVIAHIPASWRRSSVINLFGPEVRPRTSHVLPVKHWLSPPSDVRKRTSARNYFWRSEVYHHGGMRGVGADRRAGPSKVKTVPL